MRNIKKLTLTLVALFAMTAGAWADGTVTVTELKASDITAWSGDNKALTAADLPGFVEATAEQAQSWDGYPTEGMAYLIYGFDNGKMKKITYTYGGAGTPGQVDKTRGAVYYDINKSSDRYFYVTGVTGGAATGKALTPDDTRKVWTLAAMPAGNVELQVAYFPGMLTLAQADGGSIAVDGLSLGQTKAFDVPAAWSSDETLLSANDLPADFAAIDDADLPATIAAMSSDPLALLIYGFDGEKTKTASYVDGTKDDTDAGKCKRSDVSSWIEGGMKVYYAAATTLPAGFDTDGTNIYVEPKTQFQVKAVPAEGYHLVSLSDGTKTYDVDADGIATVTMPEGDADLTLTATFSDEFELTFDDVNFKTNQNITVKVGDADKTLDQDGKLSVKAGQTVTLTAKQGYKFRSVEAKKAGAAGPVTLAEATVGMVVGSDGNAYAVADKDNLPTGVTAAGVVAYKSGSNGLVIALTDEASTMNWSTANGASGAAAHTPTVTGQTWKLPSQAEWKQMFSANGGSEGSYSGLNTTITNAGGTAFQEDGYWSSTVNDEVNAYSVGLYGGSAYFDPFAKDADILVRACLAF